MHRLFVAIRPPESVRESLLDLMEGIADARWVDEDQLHLTLRFIGEVDRHGAEDVAAALASVRHPAFEIAVGGLGSFDRRSGAATLWAGVTPHEALRALHKKVDQALQRTGLEPERRAYHPHITLARLPRGAGSIQALLDRAGPIVTPPFAVREFILFESRLTPKGPIYTEAATYSLA